MTEYCRVLARDTSATAIVVHKTGDNYLLVHRQTCDYSATASAGPSGQLVYPKDTQQRHRPMPTPDWSMLMKQDQDMLDVITTIVKTGVLDG